MTKHQDLPHEVAERLGPFYVYLLVDPRDDTPFYVGKGTGQRLLHHGADAELSIGTSSKLQRIRDIRASKGEPRIDVVQHNLTEDQAFMIEAALIDCLDGLCNLVRGHGSMANRRSIDEYISMYGAEPLGTDVTPVMTIRLSRWKAIREEIEPGYFRMAQGYASTMSTQEVADATRAWWKVSPDSLGRRGVSHAVAVHEGVTRGVFEIGDWIQRADGRRAFSAQPLTSGHIHDEWLGSFGRRVPFPPKSQNPVTYWPPTIRQ